MRHGLGENVQYRSNPCLIPRRLLLDLNLRAKEGGKEKTGLAFPHQSVAFRARLYAKQCAQPCEKSSAWVGGWVKTRFADTPTDTSSLHTVSFVPGQSKPLHFLYRLIRTLSVAPPVSVLTFNEVWLYSTGKVH